ncbi:MAG: shikimate kinase [Deltaproteobacteria bacterium]|nr:MAG: shikimate kinase [Deltaproteobacteria bacterium]
MNIVLIGYRCSGKTEVGKILARELGRNSLDTDGLIEREIGGSIQGFVLERGWGHFREMEKSVIERVAKKDNLIIATGGGVVMDKENVNNLKRNGCIVWLKANPDVIEDRMRKEQGSGKLRPSLTGSDPIQEIEHVLSLRTPLYEKASDLTVDTSTYAPQQVADLIMKALYSKLDGKDK